MPKPKTDAKPDGQPRAWLQDRLYIAVPFLAVLYPMLYLYSQNISELEAGLVVRPLLLAALMTLVGTVGLNHLFRDKTKAAFSLVVFWIYFLFYGPFFNNIDAVLAQHLVRNKLMLPLWTLLAALALFMIWRSKNLSHKWLQFVTVFGLVLLAFQLINIVRYDPPVRKSSQKYQFLADQQNQTLKPFKGRLPNIYYLMPDSYPRSDTLKQYFNFDNSAWDDFLKRQGFYIAGNSHANYNHTGISVPATLNMSYIADPKPKALPSIVRRSLYQHNRVAENLKTLGYKFANNNNLYWLRDNPFADYNADCTTSNEFFNQLIMLSVLKPFDIVAEESRAGRRGDTLCVLQNISAAAVSGPKFVFTHLYPPHPPYIFGKDGEDVHEANLDLSGDTRWQAKQPYLDQLTYVNKRLTEIIGQLLKHDKDAIVIIQSDHGTLSSARRGVKPLTDKRPVVLRERSRNLSAIRLPDWCDKSQLYPSMTNVNTFRIVFNACFGTDYKKLADTVYYAGTGPYRDFEDITKIVKDKH